MTRFTVLGATGNIGSHLADHLAHDGGEVVRPARGAEPRGQSLGHAFYCIGMTADFRSRLLETVDAHVTKLATILGENDYETFTYLSSTRVYQRVDEPANETRALCVDPTHVEDLYNTSKLLGESVVLSVAGARGRVARLSNVYGGRSSPTFLSSIVESAMRGRISLQTSLESAKDYVSLEDVIALLPRIATEGRERVYNVASGTNVSHGEIVRALAALTRCQIDVAPNAPTTTFPRISVERITKEFGHSPRRVLEDLPRLLESTPASR